MCHLEFMWATGHRVSFERYTAKTSEPGTNELVTAAEASKDSRVE